MKSLEIDIATLAEMETAQIESLLDDNQTEDWYVRSTPGVYGLSTPERKQIYKDLKHVHVAMVAELKKRGAL
jgi:hypothetical protein